MSADNGVYILKCKDQYRVRHLQAIDNLYYSYLHGDGGHEIVPTRAVEMFGGKYTRDSDKAFGIAKSILQRLYVCEYGIRVIPCEKMWWQLVKEANKLAGLEIEKLEKQELDTTIHTALND